MRHTSVVPKVPGAFWRHIYSTIWTLRSIWLGRFWYQTSSTNLERVRTSAQTGDTDRDSNNNNGCLRAVTREAMISFQMFPHKQTHTVIRHGDLCEVTQSLYVRRLIWCQHGRLFVTDPHWSWISDAEVGDVLKNQPTLRPNSDNRGNCLEQLNVSSVCCSYKWSCVPRCSRAHFVPVLSLSLPVDER